MALSLVLLLALSTFLIFTTLCLKKRRNIVIQNMAYNSANSHVQSPSTSTEEYRNNTSGPTCQTSSNNGSSAAVEVVQSSPNTDREEYDYINTSNIIITLNNESYGVIDDDNDIST